MSSDDLPINCIDEPFRYVSRQHPYSGPACLGGPFRDEHLEDDPNWAIRQPRSKHQTHRIREDDDVHRLVIATLLYFIKNLDPKVFLD